MRRTPNEESAAPTSHSAVDPAEFNVVCRSETYLPNRTDSNAALLAYLTHHESFTQAVLFVILQVMKYESFRK